MTTEREQDLAAYIAPYVEVTKGKSITLAAREHAFCRGHDAATARAAERIAELERERDHQTRERVREWERANSAELRLHDRATCPLCKETFTTSPYAEAVESLEAAEARESALRAAVTVFVTMADATASDDCDWENLRTAACLREQAHIYRPLLNPTRQQRIDKLQLEIEREDQG